MAENIHSSTIKNAQLRHLEHIEGLSTASRVYKQEQSQNQEVLLDEERLVEQLEIEEKLFLGQEIERSLERQSIKEQMLRNRAHIKKVVTKSAVGHSSRWMCLNIGITSYLWQLLFAILSLVGLFGGSALETSFWTGFIDEIFGLSDVSAMFGLLCWVLSMCIVLITFLGFSLWFQMIGVAPFGKNLGLSLFSLAASITPGLNMLPFLVLWIYILTKK